MVLAAVYMSYITERGEVAGPAPSELPVEFQYNQLRAFAMVVRQSVLGGHVYFLHAAIFSLAFGVAFLPAGYLPESSAGVLPLAGGVAIVVTLVGPLLIECLRRGAGPVLASGRGNPAMGPAGRGHT
jgi:hypothetical protein